MSSSMLVEVTVLDRGSAATATASIGASVISVEDVTQFDDTGRLDIAGVQYDYLSVDQDALTITLDGTLSVAVAEFDPVSVVAGDEVAKIYSAIIDMGDGDNVTVPIPLELRPLLAEGLYDPPVPIVISPDLQSIVDVPGRVPIIQNTVLRTAPSGPRVEISQVTGPPDHGLIAMYTGGSQEDPDIPAGLYAYDFVGGTNHYTILQMTSGGVLDYLGNPVGVGSAPVINMYSEYDTATHDDQTEIDLTADLVKVNGGVKLTDSVGVLSTTTNASGQVTINHGLPFTPRFIMATNQAAGGTNHVVNCQGYTSTQFVATVRLIATGAVVASTAVDLRWLAVG